MGLDNAQKIAQRCACRVESANQHRSLQLQANNNLARPGRVTKLQVFHRDEPGSGLSFITTMTNIIAIPGDASQTNIGITKITFDILLKEEKFVELIALYAFYCYTARWQKTNQVKCTDGYAGVALHRSREHIQRVRTRLEEMKLVELVKVKNDETNKIEGFYIRVFHLAKGVIVDHVQCDPKPLEAQDHTNALITGNRNAQELVVGQAHKQHLQKPSGRKKKEEEGDLLGGAGASRKKFVPPTEQQVEECMSGLNGEAKNEAVRFVAYHTMKGWKVGGESMKDWKAAITYWLSSRHERAAQRPNAAPQQVPSSAELRKRAEEADRIGKLAADANPLIRFDFETEGAE